MPSVPSALARATFPAPVLDVLRRLGEAGHRSWLVGGAVRDLLLHRPRAATDFDVATPATPAQVGALFPKVVPTGIEHGTVTVVARGEPIEVTTFRGEGEYRDGRRPESVTFHTDLEADLARRDFTMNALAFDPLAPEFRDPFGGREDMKRRRVRAVGDPAARFGEDGLRAMRAVRFAAQLGYAIDPRTIRAVPGALAVVRRVAAERISDELGKLLVAPHAPAALGLLRRTGLLGVILPELASLPPAALDHAVRVLGRTPPELPLRLTALLHGLAPAAVAGVLERLRLSRRTTDEVQALLRAHTCLAAGDLSLPASPAEVRRWLERVRPEQAAHVLALGSAEARALRPPRDRRARAELRKLEGRVSAALAEAPALSIQDLALDGRAIIELLGVAPGPHIGEALRHLLDRVLEDPGENAPEKLQAELRRWWEARPSSL
jgi:tRNA nucleotidyltransferase (CCA-adding enzyme)